MVSNQEKFAVLKCSYGWFYSDGVDRDFGENKAIYTDTGEFVTICSVQPIHKLSDDLVHFGYIYKSGE